MNQAFVESHKVYVAIVCLMAIVSTIWVLRTVRVLERHRPDLLQAVGIGRVDFGLRCYRGFARLGFTTGGAGLTSSQRWAFRALFATYALFAMMGVLGLQ